MFKMANHLLLYDIRKNIKSELLEDDNITLKNH